MGKRSQVVGRKPQKNQNDEKKRKRYDEEAMKAAIMMVKSKKAGYLKAADTHNVPRSTLFRLCTAGNSSGVTTLGRKPVFPVELEKMLVSYLLEMEKSFFGMTRSDVRRFAYQLARVNRIPSPFNKENESAGK